MWETGCESVCVRARARPQAALSELGRSGELRDEEFSDGLIRTSLSMLQVCQPLLWEIQF